MSKTHTRNYTISLQFLSRHDVKYISRCRTLILRNLDGGNVQAAMILRRPEKVENCNDHRFEQHLYLRQPGYGTCYITGKYLVERLIAEYAEMKERDEKSFVMKDFMREFNKVGNIPIELLRWDMTGKKPKSIP